jgi:uncharacterized integral membrane protein
MRWFHVAVIAVLGVIILILAVQNLHSVTISFLGLALTIPLVLVIILVYVLGMITGGSLWSLVQWAMAGINKGPAAK